MELKQDGHFWLIMDGDEAVAKTSGSRRFATRILDRLEAAKPKEVKKKVAKKKVAKKATKKTAKKK